MGIAYEGQHNRILSSSEAMHTWSSTLQQFSDRSRWPKRDKEFIIGLINESEARGRIAFVPAEAQGQEGKLVALEQARGLVTSVACRRASAAASLPSGAAAGLHEGSEQTRPRTAAGDDSINGPPVTVVSTLLSP
ncbi:MAG TPA: hypothetical protein VHY19_04550 [Steroidobacteraceae bacterium]|nr:hypothetical protein [Steroidobacteraceae bacterium]